MKKTNNLLFALLIAGCSFGQEDSVSSDDSYDNSLLSASFYATRIVNGHSTAVLPKGTLEYRIEHRFGDLAGTNGGVQEWFGLDGATDIRMALEYGITKNLMVGLGRSRGTGVPYRSLVDGFLKYRILQQDKSTPVSLSVVGASTYTYMKSSDNIYDLNHFTKTAYRIAYTTQAIVSRTFGRRISASLMPTYVYRNYVRADDLNGLLALGGGIKCGITAQMGIVAEYYQVLAKSTSTVRPDNTNSFGIGVEWITFGHTFTINLTNSKGFTETQFIPYTKEQWNKGQFRLGFSITRKFSWE